MKPKSAFHEISKLQENTLIPFVPFESQHCHTYEASLENSPDKEFNSCVTTSQFNLNYGKDMIIDYQSILKAIQSYLEKLMTM